MREGDENDDDNNNNDDDKYFSERWAQYIPILAGISCAIRVIGDDKNKAE